MTRPQEELWSSVPESYYHRIEVCQRLQRRIEEPGEEDIMLKMSQDIQNGTLQNPCLQSSLSLFLDPRPWQGCLQASSLWSVQ